MDNSIFYLLLKENSKGQELSADNNQDRPADKKLKTMRLIKKSKTKIGKIIYKKPGELQSLPLWWLTSSKEKREELKKIIIKEGIKKPLFITKTFLILDGHNRWKIAKELKFSKIPCHVCQNFGEVFKILFFGSIENIMKITILITNRFSLEKLTKIFLKSTNALVKGLTISTKK